MMLNKCKVLLILSIITFVSGCSTIGSMTTQLKGAGIPQEESANTAVIRMSTSHGGVRLIPNSSVVDFSKPGAGMVFYNGMPVIYKKRNPNVTFPAITEDFEKKNNFSFYVQGDEPVVIQGMFVCDKPFTFTPKSGHYYQIVLDVEYLSSDSQYAKYNCGYRGFEVTDGKLIPFKLQVIK